MSMITRPLPDYVEIEGIRYLIHTDFKNWIEIGSILSDRSAPMPERLVKVLKLCYHRDSLPPKLEEAAYALLSFYAGGQTANGQKKGNPGRKKPIYDFEHDAEYIFAAFMAQYHIDLTVTNMHWHKFRALFAGLTDDNKICKIMEYRAIDLSKIKDKEQKAFYRKMKGLYRLPDMRTEEEKDADVLSELAEGF